MSPISENDVVETIRERTDIVDIISCFLKLKKKGEQYVGLCPFHHDKTPSFTVNAQKGLFHCFGCNASGDVFSFLMRMQGKTFLEVLEELATRAGVQLPKRRQKRDKEFQTQKHSLLQLNEIAANFYQQCLWNSVGHTARDYLQQRQIGNNVARDFHLGYAPPGWQNLRDHLKHLEIHEQEVSDSGLVVRGERGVYDMFRNRLIFPIIGIDGKIHGFGARKLDPRDQGGKYINSPQTPVFNKSTILYGFYQARSAIQRMGRAIIVEGYLDVLSLAEHGVQGAVATCGTALSQDHVRVLRRFCDRVVTAFDADEAGVKASSRAAEFLVARDLSSYMVVLPTNEDPDSYIRKYGHKRFGRLVQDANPSVVALAELAWKKAGDNIEARHHALQNLLPLLAACTDRIRLGNYLGWLAERFHIDESDLRCGVAEYHKKQNIHSTLQNNESLKQQSTCPFLPLDEVQCVALIMQYPMLAKQALEEKVVESFQSKVLQSLLKKIVHENTSTSFAAKLALIDDAAVKEHLAAMLVKTDELPYGVARGNFSQCIRKIKTLYLKVKEHKLQEQIDKAQQAGEQEQTRELQVVKQQIARERMLIGVPVKGFH